MTTETDKLTPAESGGAALDRKANSMAAVVQRLRRADVRWRETCGVLVCLVLIPLLVMVFAKQKYGFYGPSLNLDLFVVCIVAIGLSRSLDRSATFLALLGLIFVLGVHIFTGVGLIFVFDPLLLLDYVQFFAHWPWLMVGAITAGAVLGLGALYFALRPFDLRRARILPGVALLALGIGVDVWARTPSGFEVIGQNFATSSVATVVDLAKSAGKYQEFKPEPQPGSSLASAVLAQPTLPNRILSISVEAYGIGKDPQFNELMSRGLLHAVAADYEVERTVHQFKGLTMAGEFRELCATRISVIPKRSDAERVQAQCLPYRLAKLGYATTGLHGNTGFFYMRDQIYPALGFQRAYFHRELQADGGVDCPSRSFPGICDRDVMRTGLNLFGKSPKEFVHIVTLDTHFPFYSKSKTDRDCSRLPKVKLSDLCLYANQQSDALSQIGRSIAAAKVKPDLIYIYGDHPPPYIEADMRYFFDREQVPVFILRRRPDPAGA